VSPRPTRLVVVTGTGTEVGKTWWVAALARALREEGRAVAARKPVQSFAPTDAISDLDASVLGAATGVTPETVCPSHRWLVEPMAPPMAAARLGLAPFTIADLAAEITWPEHCEVGLVEGAGGLRSPLADDGDTLALIDALAPDDIVVVAHAALGVVHNVRLVLDALAAGNGRDVTNRPPRTVTVALNHFDDRDPLHVTSRVWLVDRDGLTVVTAARELAARWA
jgi:dethiobiotin synthase